VSAATSVAWSFFGVWSAAAGDYVVSPDVGHLMRDDQMMCGVDGDLDIVADDTAIANCR
jgi:hypothetical protein